MLALQKRYDYSSISTKRCARSRANPTQRRQRKSGQALGGKPFEETTEPTCLLPCPSEIAQEIWETKAGVTRSTFLTKCQPAWHM
jgi:hypothetical protein